MPYTKRQKAAAGAELARRRAGGKASGPLADMTMTELRHMASKSSGARKKTTRKR